MNPVVSALAQGFLAVLLHWRLVLTMWVLTAATAWLVAAPYGPAIDATVLHNPLAGQLLAQFDNEAYVDFGNVQAGALAAGSRASQVVALPWIVLWSLLSAGMLARLIDGRRHPRLLTACGTYAHRTLWLLLLTAAPLLGLWWVNDRLTAWLTGWLVDGLERGAGANLLGWSMTLKTVVMLGLVLLVLAIGRLARVRMIARDEHFVPLIWLRTAGAVLRRLHLIAPGLLLSTLPLWLVIGIYQALTHGLLAGAVQDGGTAWWRYVLVAQGVQVLVQAALLYRLAVEVKLWPLIAPREPDDHGKPAALATLATEPAGAPAGSAPAAAPASAPPTQPVSTPAPTPAAPPAPAPSPAPPAAPAPEKPMFPWSPPRPEPRSSPLPLPTTTPPRPRPDEPPSGGSSPPEPPPAPPSGPRSGPPGPPPPKPKPEMPVRPDAIPSVRLAFPALLVAASLALAGGALATGARAQEPPPLPAPMAPAAKPAAPAAPRVDAAAPSQARERAADSQRYVIEATLDLATRTVTASELITFKNTSSQPVSELWLHVYAAAFSNTATTLMREGDASAVTERGEEAGGYIDIQSVSRPDGTSLRAATQIDDTLMRIDLGAPLPPGAETSVKIAWVTRFPRIIRRMGWQGPHLDGMQWYPKLCVLSDAGWVTEQFHNSGEFFGEFGRYEVTFTLPASLPEGAFEATGVPAVIESGAGGRLVRYSASGVHDFAFCADPNFVRFERRFEEPTSGRSIDIIYLCQPYAEPKAEQVLSVVEDALHDSAEWWLPYPYERIVIDGLPHDRSGGMEYPMLFTISQRFPSQWGWLNELTEDPASVTAHEFGHQYWYGILASNEFEEAWLDEGVNSFTTLELLESHFPDAGKTDALTFIERDLLRDLFNGGWRGRLPLVKDHALSLQELIGWRSSPFHNAPPEDPASRPSLLGWTVPPLHALRLPDMSANRAAWEKRRYYEDARVLPLTAPSRDFTRAYSSLVYDKTTLMLETLQRHVGPETMRSILRTYATRFQFTHPTGADLLGVISEATGGAHDALLRQLIETTGTVDYTVEQVRCRADPGLTGFSPQQRPGDPVEWRDPSSVAVATARWRTTYVVRQLGEIVAPVEVEARFADGTAIRGTWDGAGRQGRFEHQTDAELVEVVVDPERKFAIDLDINNNGWRKLPALDTARTLKAISHFWAQNVLDGWSFLF